MARTERELDSWRRDEKWQTCWCCRDQQRTCTMVQASTQKLEHTGPAEKERVASVPQRAVGKYARAALAKRKWNGAVCPEYQIMRGESQSGQEPHLDEREGDQNESMKRKEWTPP